MPSRRLTAHRIPVRPGRTNALVQLAQDLPPAVLALMLGLHTVTTARWRHRAATDWTAYLEACTTARAATTASAGATAGPGPTPSTSTASASPR
ncbi:hypothetical protein ACGF13_38555 [Kitasatospora sp. NPDC048286]|uniref:hypothetical protein n=1 Tax=Kitasatospora sp. NPDC048286 TaxID=3364047 RepID=UPI0037198BA2